MNRFNTNILPDCPMTALASNQSGKISVMFRVQVVFTNAVRAKSYHSQIAPHDFSFIHKAGDRHERLMGTQVLLDILLLAKCDHFLHAESSVASLASYFNPYIKSYFIEPGKYDKVCLFVTSIGRIWKATSWQIKQLKR